MEKFNRSWQLGSSTRDDINEKSNKEVGGWRSLIGVGSTSPNRSICLADEEAKVGHWRLDI